MGRRGRGRGIRNSVPRVWRTPRVFKQGSDIRFIFLKDHSDCQWVMDHRVKLRSEEGCWFCFCHLDSMQGKQAEQVSRVVIQFLHHSPSPASSMGLH